MTPNSPTSIPPTAEPVRLAKRVAELLRCSRSDAEQFIAGGYVLVDGVVVEEPQYRVLQQTVALADDAKLGAAGSEAVTLLLHKPPAYSAAPDGSAPEPLFAPATQLLVSANQLELPHIAIKPLKRHLSNLSNMIALETGASGLLVYTQDRRISKKLVDDAATLEHEVIVEIAGTLSNTGLKHLNHGLHHQGQPLAPAKVSWQNETRLRFAIKGPQLGQIAWMCESVGVQVVAMKRIRLGRIAMSNLPSGQWRYLAGFERF